MRPDGSDDHRVASDIADQQMLPDWSPDGTTLVFTTRGGDSEPLYEYDLATDTARQLFDCDDPCLGDDEPAYSPDGTHVAFIRASAPFVASAALAGAEVPSDCGLWIGNVSSGEVRQVTTNTDPACDREYGVRWSPDGSKLAYWRDPYEAGQPTGTYVVVFDLESATETVLTDPADNLAEPDWSPDGEWLVVDSYPIYEFETAPAGSNLYRMHPDGTGLEQLTYFDRSRRAAQPRYTPDGRWILFTVQDDDRPSTRSTWIVPADGGDPSPLTEPPGLRTHATLQP